MIMYCKYGFVLFLIVVVFLMVVWNRVIIRICDEKRCIIFMIKRILRYWFSMVIKDIKTLIQYGNKGVFGVFVWLIKYL